MWTILEGKAAERNFDLNDALRQGLQHLTEWSL